MVRVEPFRRHHDAQPYADSPLDLADGGVLDAGAGEGARRAPPEWGAPAVARGLAAANGTGEIRGGGAADAPLVRRAGNAASLHSERRSGLLRQPLPAQSLLPGGRG